MASIGHTSQQSRRTSNANSSDSKAHEFTLYVTGSTASSNATIAQFRHFCEEQWSQGYVLEVVDLHDDPAAAANRGVFVTPTLVVQIDGKTKKLVGNFGDVTAVARELGLSSAQ